MKKTARIERLRDRSLQAIEHISGERATLVTAYYKSMDGKELPVPIQRAQCFAYLLEHKELYIGSEELIVGERGPKPKATPTYPEINLHTLQDLDILNSREKVSFKVNKEVRDLYEQEIIPFWLGKNNRERVMNAMLPEWKAAYKAGMFTEFQEQRAPGHTVLGERMFKQGFKQVIQEIDASISRIKVESQLDKQARLDELEAMRITAQAIVDYAKRHASLLLELAEKELDAHRKEELIEMARICNKVPAEAPESVHEMLQHYWFIHLGVISELNPWDSFNPGRLDQHLLPVYNSDLEKGMDEAQIYELLQAFWVKFNNHPAPPKVGVTALESNTYTDFCLINTGGLTAAGEDGVNPVSFIILDVIEEMRLLQPSSMIQVSRKNPDEFIHRALKIVKTGFGQPSIFNTDAIIQQLLSQGKSLVHARNGGASGCVETGAFGTESYMLTGYFNLLKVLEITLNNGYDTKTETQVGIKTGELSSFASYHDLFEAYTKQLNHFISIKIEGNKRIETLFAENLPAPFLSTLIEGCISSGKDYNAGGALYNTSYIQGVGLGTLTDSFTAIKYHVFDEGRLTLSDFHKQLQSNYSNAGDFRRELVYETPKYGNDNDYADAEAIRIFNAFHKAVDGKPTARGGIFRINMLPTTCHVYFGQVSAASADGRLKGEPLSEGISPVQGADKNGPTSVIKSAAKFNHLLTGGTLLNQKFIPSFFEYAGAYKNLTALIRSYFSLNGHHIQFNVVDAKTLKKAQKEPEKYKDLIVRVAGYSDYFNDLGIDLQNEIIHRTEQSIS